MTQEGGGLISQGALGVSKQVIGQEEDQIGGRFAISWWSDALELRYK